MILRPVLGELFNICAKQEKFSRQQLINGSKDYVKNLSYRWSGIYWDKFS